MHIRNRLSVPRNVRMCAILIRLRAQRNVGIHTLARNPILTNPSNTKSGTISLRNRDFCPKSGTFLKNLAKMAKNGNIRGKMLHTRNHKNRDMPYFIRRKRGTSRILAPKIGTVPPKSGRLESMLNPRIAQRFLQGYNIIHRGYIHRWRQQREQNHHQS